jgi:prepilin-type N-terminal cleavage/methylation domain-containing protein
MSTNPDTSERGFTLIEVLIAMIILTVALVSMAELMAITLRMQMMGRNETAAIRLVQSKIDELVALDFDGASASPLIVVGGSVEDDVNNYNDSPLIGFDRRWQISAIAGETDIRLLTVRIIPTTADRRTQSDITVTTIIRNCCPDP